jgi:predicted alpha/beta superfamily hydrolase
MKQLIILAIAGLILSCQKAHETIESRPSSAQENVHVLAPIMIQELSRERLIRVYLPPDYKSSNNSYPVIYAHDGQNLFDDTTSYVGEWGLDESLNQLASEIGFEAILVGIDNGQAKRINELSPWTNEKYGVAEGDEYLNFIVNQLKPMIDSTYRTMPEREHTAIMGSSLGGLMSHYAIYRYPGVFSKAIIFSPSYWYAEEVWNFTTAHPLPQDAKIWLEIGAKEGEAVDNTNKMYEVILATGHPQENIVRKIDPEGEHNETSWRRQFVPAVKWLFAISE